MLYSPLDLPENEADMQRVAVVHVCLWSEPK
jgi:hypothetical protein